MDYEYDVFISYRREGNAQKWVEDHFVPTLYDSLAPELPAAPRIFFDGDMEVATTWPTALGQTLARSKMLISLWSKEYLSSQWCAKELAQMRAREAELGMRTAVNANGLIFVCVIHDGEKMPPEVGLIQRVDIKDYFRIRMRKDSEDADALEIKLRAIAPKLAAIIQQSPQFSPSWEAIAGQAFYDLYLAKTATMQNEPPSFTGR